MDSKHRLQDMDDIQSILYTYPSPIYVFCGHYHVEKVIHSQNMHLHITPSCYVQIGQEKAEFEAVDYRIAMRIIDVDNHVVKTSVQYFDGAKV